MNRGIELRKWLFKRPILHKLYLETIDSGDSGGDVSGKCLVGLNTEIIIEGFPRCGNTFLVECFKEKNPKVKNKNIGKHIHAPTSLYYGNRFEIPTLLLIRNPEQVISSYAIIRSDVPLELIIDLYITYYEESRKYNCLVFDFEDTINNYSHIIEKVNATYNASFIGGQMSEEQIRKVKARLKSVDNYGVQGSFLPNELKERNKNKIIKELKRRKYINKMKEAWSIYNQIVEEGK